MHTTHSTHVDTRGWPRVCILILHLVWDRFSLLSTASCTSQAGLCILPCLPCAVGLLGLQEQTPSSSFLQWLQVFRLWTSCLCGHLSSPHFIFRVEIKHSSGHCSDQSRSESLASLSHFILELWWIRRWKTLWLKHTTAQPIMPQNLLVELSGMGHCLQLPTSLPCMYMHSFPDSHISPLTKHLILSDISPSL